MNVRQKCFAAFQPAAMCVAASVFAAATSSSARADSAAADWPQFQCNAARTGWTPDSPAPPFEELYRLEFGVEPLGLTQPIVYLGTIYIPTLHGRLYAVDPDSGTPRWVAERLGPIPRTAAAADGLVYTASAEGNVSAVKVEDGVCAWSRDLGAGISASPCVDNGLIYIGARNGDFFCLDGKTGQTLWQTRFDHYVWSSAAAADGRVYVVTDGALHLYCLAADDGAVLWKSGKLPGVFARDWCPVVTAGKVFVRTLPAEYLRDYAPAPYSIWWAGLTREKFLEYYPHLLRGELTPDILQANDAMVAHYTANPWMQTMHAFDAETGEQPYVCGAFHLLAQWLMASAPPAVDSQGMLQTAVAWFGSRHGRLDPNTGRIADILVGPLMKKEYAPGEPQPYEWDRIGSYMEGGPEQMKADGFGGNSDETHASSAGGDRVYFGHWHGPRLARGFAQNVVFDLNTREMLPLLQKYDDAKRKKISVEQPRRKWLFDGGQSDAATAPVPWRDLLIHHWYGGVTVLRGSNGAEGGGR